MSESEWIKKYPFCFKAFLNDEYANILGVHFEDEAHYPESMIGAYLNWFLSKTGKDEEITKLKKALEIANEAIEFYADPFSYNTQSNVLGHERPIRDVSFMAWKDDDFIYQGNVGGKRAREAQKQIKELMEG